MINSVKRIALRAYSSREKTMCSSLCRYIYTVMKAEYINTDMKAEYINTDMKADMNYIILN